MKKKNNIIICSAGRRVELIESFKNSLKQVGISANVYATDIKPEISAACQVADNFFRTPSVSNKSYIKFLLNLCIDMDVGIVVPTIDTELLPLSLNKDLFNSYGIHLIISSSMLVSNCRDKRKTEGLFRSINISSIILIIF